MVKDLNGVIGYGWINRSYGGPWGLRLYVFKDRGGAQLTGLHSIYHFFSAIDAVAAGKDAGKRGDAMGANIDLSVAMAQTGLLH